MEYITRTGTDLVQKADSEKKAEKLRGDLDNLTMRWTDVSSNIDQRVDKLETTITQMRQYQVSVDQLISIGLCCFFCNLVYDVGNSVGPIPIAV